jgi:putative sigma-54 modulation protein
MSVEVTARHLNTVGDVQDYARQRGERLREEFPRVEHVHIILNVEKYRQIAEVVVQAKNHGRMESAEDSDNLRVSVDRAVEKVEKQLRKLTEKVHDHKAAMKYEQAHPAGEESGAAVR